MRISLGPISTGARLGTSPRRAVRLLVLAIAPWLAYAQSGTDVSRKTNTTPVPQNKAASSAKGVTQKVGAQALNNSQDRVRRIGLVVGSEHAVAHRHYVEWLLEDRMSERGAARGSMLNALRQTQSMPASVFSRNSFWQPLGPAPLVDRAGTSYGGRTNSIAIDPRDPNIIYLGAALGGVWKTIDGGQSWFPLTDDQPSLASGAIALAPSNPDTIYVGTGEENFSGDSLYGAGILRSDNGGMIWTQLGADIFVDPNGGGARTSRMLVDPNDSGTVYVATTWGLWKSSDGGQTWALKLSSRTQAAITDLVMAPNNPAVLYAAVSVPNSAMNKGVYLSIDFGETWQQLNLPLAANQLGRINIAIAPSNPQILYASIGNAGTGTAQMFRLKSIDGGKTWQQLPACTAGCNQQSYNNIIRIHPENPDIVYQGAVNLFRTTDGGQTWTNTTRGHVDHHWLVFDQSNNLYIGSDGGIFRINPDDSTSNLNTNLGTLQFYAGVALHPTNPNLMLGGLQDNGSVLFSGSPTWLRVCGGDGAYQAIEGQDGDPDNVWYCSSQHLGLNKTVDGGQTFHSARTGLDTSDAAFVAPYLIDPNNSQVLITATRGIWRTENATASWQRNSDAVLSTTSFRSLAFAPRCSKTTYFAGSSGHIWRTADTGLTWVDISQGFPSTVVTHIAVSLLDCDTVYATFSGFGVAHIFRSNDAGNTWINISSNLPNVPTNALLLDTTGDSPVLYVGTDIGVFCSLDDGGSWELCNNGLPNVRVEDLVLSPMTGVLVASTHGRGMWQLVSGSSSVNREHRTLTQERRSRPQNWLGGYLSTDMLDTPRPSK